MKTVKRIFVVTDRNGNDHAEESRIFKFDTIQEALGEYTEWELLKMINYAIERDRRSLIVAKLKAGLDETL